MKAIAQDFVANVHNEMLRVRGFEVVGREVDEHEREAVRSERQIIEEHARHFLDRIESIITIR